MSGNVQNSFVAKSISELYLQSEIADVHFAFENDGQIVKVPAHKTILAANNLVFRAMFFGPMKENEVVDIVDADASAFEEFLQFFYLSEVTLTIQNIEAVVRLADKYNMLDCFNSCATFLEGQLNIDNIFWDLQLAIMLGNEKLKQTCLNEIRHVDCETFKSSEFLQCDREVLKVILQMEVLWCNEAELFDACIEWAKSSCQANALDKNQSENVKNQLGDCLHLIQFGSIPDEEIGRIMSDESYKGLFTKDEMAEIVCIRTMKDFQPKIFKCIKRSLPNFDVLTCNRKATSGQRYAVTNRESTWFSTNSPVLLSEIVCNYVYNVRGTFTEMNSYINIIEYNEQTFPTNGASKTRYEGTVNITRDEKERCVLLSRPIRLDPRKMYEIRLEKISSPSNEIFHDSTWKSEVILDGGVTINFHMDPTIDNSQHGLVSQLKFNRFLK